MSAAGKPLRTGSAVRRPPRGTGAIGDWSVFFSHWLRNPLGIASAVPSRPLVGRALARQLDFHHAGMVVELGGGIGTITSGLLAGGCPAERLVVVEREPEFARILRRRFPAVRVVEGDATKLGVLLAGAGVDRLAGIASSLPVKWFTRAQQQALVRQSFDLLGEEGRFLQVTNALRSPLPGPELGIDGEEVGRVWLNFLPIRIWRYRRRA